MDILEALRTELGDDAVVTGDAMGPWCHDWTGGYTSAPLAVVRPRETAGVSAVMRAAQASGTAVVPISGNTGLNGGASTQGGLLLSLDRMKTIRAIDATARSAVVDAGVILSQMHDAAAAHDLIFPLTFGARGSAMIGGVLSTNAGGSNVLRYGNTRDLVLGIEAVLPNGRVMDLMGHLHKDNTGLNLKHLMIGAEGTLGIITAAVLRLFPKPRAYATAMVALNDLGPALDLLNRVQDASRGAVEAFEFMPDTYIDGHLAIKPDARPPFDRRYPVNILIELGATAAQDTTPLADGTVPITNLLEDILGQMIADGTVLDAHVAASEAQRRDMWARREAAGEIGFRKRPLVDTDVAVGLTDVDAFLRNVRSGLLALDPDATDWAVSHLGDGNVHYVAYPSRDDPALIHAIRAMVDALTADLNGSFSAEHGIGLSKRISMARHKDPAALDAMRAIKAALDPHGIMNPGKMLPDV
ncbi:FAD-binding oxidoreductase [Loktanella sp. DSM 29012]|uniref:FAD-binding oxidoreductase n=1 Tax=Loktanella sp. DSM 29012 TaxID=1881056 RepID=UPI000B7F2599|nr:FAD-binding oxidoreductase [Loktanella sp. DSM 29012]